MAVTSIINYDRIPCNSDTQNIVLKKKKKKKKKKEQIKQIISKD